MSDKCFWRIVTFVFAAAVSFPFLGENLLAGHDIFFHLERIYGLATGLDGESFPVKNYGGFMNGYGYPVGFFYPDLFLYPPALLYRWGIPLTVSYKILGVAMNVAAFFVARFAFVRLLKDEYAGSIVAILYGASVYRLINVYPRAALGEALAMTFLPLFLAGLWLMYRRDERYYLMTAAGFAGIAFSHVISAVMAAFVFLAVALVCIGSLKKISARRALVKAALFSFLLTAWFFVPFADFYFEYDFSMKAVTTGRVFDHFAASRIPPADIVALSGFTGAPAIFLAAAYAAYRLRAKGRLANDGAFFVGWGLGVFALFFWSDIFPWKVIDEIPPLAKALGFMQFSYRIMMWGAVAFALCSGIALAFFCRRKRSVAVLALLAVVAYNVALLVVPCGQMEPFWQMRVWYETTPWQEGLQKLAHPDVLGDNPQNAFANPQISAAKTLKEVIDVERGADSPLNPGILYDDYAYADLNIKRGDFFASSTNARQILPPSPPLPPFVSSLAKSGEKIILTADAPQETAVSLPLFYYPFYVAKTEDGNEAELFAGDMHLMQVVLPPGRSRIIVFSEGKTLYRIAEIVSLVSWIVFAFCVRRKLFWRT